MEIRILQGYWIPTAEVREFGFIAAFVEIAPDSLIGCQFKFREYTTQEIKRNAKLNAPFAAFCGFLCGSAYSYCFDLLFCNIKAFVPGFAEAEKKCAKRIELEIHISGVVFRIRHDKKFKAAICVNRLVHCPVNSLELVLNGIQLDIKSFPGMVCAGIGLWSVAIVVPREIGYLCRLKVSP